MNIDETKMTESILSSSVKEALSNSILYNSELSDINNKLLEQYSSMPYGDEVDGNSQVVTTDISDVVESDIASLVRLFLNGGKILEFVPVSGRPQDVQEAKEKTEYINHIVSTQKNSFKILHDWMKSALIQKYSVIKYFIDNITDVEEVKFRNVNEDELIIIEEEYQNNKNIKSVELVSRTEGELKLSDELKQVISQAVKQDFDLLPEEQQDSLISEAGFSKTEIFDVVFRIIEEKEVIKIQGVPTENFIMTEGVMSKDDAPVVGDRITKTRGDLLAQGYDRELIDSLPSSNDEDANINDTQARTRDEISYGSSNSLSEGISNWASQEVEIYDLYVKIDFDGDGIAERRHILMSGDVILENEVFNHVPYAMLSAILMPFEAIGRSRAELAQVTQRMKTVTMRLMMDNSYMANNQRIAANENVNIDDLLDVRPNGIVRVEGDNPINNDLIPLSTPFTGDRSLLILQHLDNSRANSTGNFIANQGLDKDAVSKETATRFQGVKDAGAAKIELVSRNFAETGFKDLFEGLAWLVKRYKDDAIEISVHGKPIIINPSNWSDNYIMDCQMLDENKQLESMQFMYQLQTQLMQSGSLLTDQTKVFNTLSKIGKGLGVHDISKYFNDPSQPDQLLMAQNQQMQAQIQQLSAQVEQMANPLAEAEKIKAESSLIQANAKQQLDIAKLQENQRQFDAKLQKEREQFEEKMIEKLTELELKYNKDVPNSLV